MGRNRLKDIFSTNPPLPEIKLLFQNAEAETQFEKAMYLAWDEGHPVNVEGVNGIIAYDSSTSRKMPFLFEDNLEGFMVGPSSETRAFDITTPKGRTSRWDASPLRKKRLFGRARILLYFRNLHSAAQANVLTTQKFRKNVLSQSHS